jgi:hypothetical protein
MKYSWVFLRHSILKLLCKPDVEPARLSFLDIKRPVIDVLGLQVDL